MLKILKKLMISSRSNKSEEIGLNLGSIKIDESPLEIDFKVLDRYQSFSSEILRLSLICIGAYAFLLKDTPDIFKVFQNNNLLKYISIASIISFAIAIACTLAHRYYSSDFMAYHIRYLRIKQHLKDSQKRSEKVIARANEEKTDRDVILKFCELMIASSAFFFGLGAVFLAISLLSTIFKQIAK